MTSPELQGLLNEIKNCLIERPVNLPGLRLGLDNLLSFLTTPAGQTGPNCEEADLFFSLHGENGFDWDTLPEEFQLVFNDMGGKLHDSIRNPERARELQSTPELLLGRVRRISVAGD